jgi:protein phosphatase
VPEPYLGALKVMFLEGVTPRRPQGVQGGSV